MQRRLPPHPSGRPIYHARRMQLSIPRIPADGPLTPSLQSRDLGEAIGFHAEFIKTAEPEEDE